MERHGRRPPAPWIRPAVSAAVVALVASPAVRQRDSYPLSTYPVYADARPGVADLPTAVGVTAAGDRVRLTPTVIGASDDPLIVADRVADAIAGGRAERLCRAIAQRAAAEGAAVAGLTAGTRAAGAGTADTAAADSGTTDTGTAGGTDGPAGLTAVEVVTETVDLVATATEGATPPLARTVHARCPVPPP